MSRAPRTILVGVAALAGLALAVAPAEAKKKAAPAAATAPPAAPAPLAASDFRPVDPQNLLVIDTTQGRVLVEMTPEVAPAHVAQVRALALQHFYDGQSFFRVIDQFMAQTGDPKNKGDGGSTLPDLKAEFTFRRSAQTRFVTVATPTGAEVGFVGALPVMSQASALMSMTADGRVSAWGLYCAGVAGMARSEGPDTANSQFFLMRQTYPALEKRYTAWGRAVSGVTAVRAIKAGEPVPEPQDRMITLRLASDLPEAQRPRVLVADPAQPGVRALIERTRAAKGADFSICDVDLPARVEGGSAPPAVAAPAVTPPR